MKLVDFKEFTLRGPVYAAQLVPGMEDDWVATSATGEVLSVASTEQSVRTAAPGAAAYAPMLRLPGLDGKPLLFGSYVVRMPDGNFTVLTRGVFEEIYGPAAAS
jgi:hypothetical protein